MSSKVSPVMATGANTVIENPPVGFRFHPNDDELVSFYLKLMLHGYDGEDMPIGMVNFYELEPWELPGLSKIKSNDRVWYFFYVRIVLKNKSKIAYQRKTKAGYWRPGGETQKVGKGKIGRKNRLVFHRHGGKGGKGVRTEWVIHEYEIPNSNLPNSGELVVIKLKRKLVEKTKEKRELVENTKKKRELVENTKKKRELVDTTKKKRKLITLASDFENQNQNIVTAYDSRKIITSDFENQNQNVVTAYDSRKIITSDFENQSLGMAYNIREPRSPSPMAIGCEEQSATVLEEEWSHQTTSASDFENQNEVTTTYYGGLQIIPFDYKYQGMTYDLDELSSPMTSNCEVQLEGEWNSPTTSTSDFENQNKAMTYSSYSHHEIIPSYPEYQGNSYDIGIPSYPSISGCEIQLAVVLEGELSPTTTSASDFENQNAMTANPAGVGCESIPLDLGNQNLEGTNVMSIDDICEPINPMAFGCENQSSALEVEEGEWCCETTWPSNLENKSTCGKSKIKYPMVSDFVNQIPMIRNEGGDRSPSVAAPPCENEVAYEIATSIYSASLNCEYNPYEENGVWDTIADDQWILLDELFS